MRSRAPAIWRSSSLDRGGVRVALAGKRARPRFQFLHFAFALRDAFFNGAGFAHLRFQAAARALGFHLKCRQLATQLRQPRFGLVAQTVCSRSRSCSLAVTSSESVRNSWKPG